MLSATEQTSVDSATTADQLKALNDPTIIQPSIWLDTEWDQYKHGSEEATWTLAGLWARRIRDGQDLALRLKVPFVYDRSDAASGHADVGGLGDIEIGTGTAFRVSNTWRTAGGIELHADTASNPALGDSVWRLHSSWSVAHDVTNWLSLTFTADYNHSIAEENDVEPQRYLELSLPATFILPTIGRSVRITKQKSILKTATTGLTRWTWAWLSAFRMYQSFSAPHWRSSLTAAIKSFKRTSR